MSHHLILVVDDRESVADSLAFILRRYGYECQRAYSGEQALTLAADNPPELLISDIMMPGMDGYELAEQITTKFPACKVILHTGNPGCIKPSFHVLEKPVRPEVMLGEIRQLLATA